MNPDLTIYEEETNLIWGLIVIVATAGATYFLGDAFVDDSLFTIGFRQLVALFLIALSFNGILKISEPLYRFELRVEDNKLIIEAYKGDHSVKSFRYQLENFEELRFAPKTPSSKDEALFDFSPNYYLVYKPRGSDQFEKLIDLGDVSFTLKVPDIAKIIRYLRRHKPSIQLPADQKTFLE